MENCPRRGGLAIVGIVVRPFGGYCGDQPVSVIGRHATSQTTTSTRGGVPEGGNSLSVDADGYSQWWWSEHRPQQQKQQQQRYGRYSSLHVFGYFVTRIYSNGATDHR